MANDFKWYGKNIMKDVGIRRERGVTKGLEFLLDQSNKRVPVDEKTLLKSGTVTVVDGGRDGAVSYNTPYAVRQHEALHYQHPNGREAKYLENTVKQDGATARGYIENEMKKAFK